MSGEAASKLLELASVTGITVIKPVFDPQSPTCISYPEAEAAFGTKGEATVDLLDRLHDEGVVSRVLVNVVMSCPLCGFLELRQITVCPKCGSRKLSVGDAIFRCESCGSTSPNVEHSLLCTRCGNTVRRDAVRYKPIYAYMLTKRSLPSSASGRRLEISGWISVRDSTLENAIKLLNEIAARLEIIAQQLSGGAASPSTARKGPAAGTADEKAKRPTAMEVQSEHPLSDAILKTLNALSSLGKATAAEISKITGRARSLESVYLNHLVYLGLVRKYRQGKRIVFAPLGGTEKRDMAAGSRHFTTNTESYLQ